MFNVINIPKFLFSKNISMFQKIIFFMILFLFVIIVYENFPEYKKLSAMQTDIIKVIDIKTFTKSIRCEIKVKDKSGKVSKFSGKYCGFSEYDRPKFDRVGWVKIWMHKDKFYQIADLNGNLIKEHKRFEIWSVIMFFAYIVLFLYIINCFIKMLNLKNKDY